MESGTISLERVGSFDLQSTLESGQSYTWDRADGRMYERTGAVGATAWYHTVVPKSLAGTDAFVRVRQIDERLEWESSIDAHEELCTLLRLDDDLDAIIESFPEEPAVSEALDRFYGMRLVRDPPFSTLISFICSAQMRVSRIHQMQRRLAESYGTRVTFDGQTYHAFPTPEQLATATESELRSLKLGYRAPYVRESAKMVASGAHDPTKVRELSYESARSSLTEFVGVGEKVADCVLLFSLGFLEAVPLDTWIRRAIAERFPDCDRGTYAETSRAIRARLGDSYAGYVQTYLFHHLRTKEMASV
ncbi:DNA-3-methyladenine glycosylase family protein [Halocatena halophila]|uniref:DNA-3-methyladenine glycosylase family protein n=1 Tax=Halocatena halophila TaxID=2814576 RepID=UPI002ED0420D